MRAKRNAIIDDEVRKVLKREVTNAHAYAQKNTPMLEIRIGVIFKGHNL